MKNFAEEDIKFLSKLYFVGHQIFSEIFSEQMLRWNKLKVVIQSLKEELNAKRNKDREREREKKKSEFQTKSELQSF